MSYTREIERERREFKTYSKRERDREDSKDFVLIDIGSIHVKLVCVCVCVCVCVHKWKECKYPGDVGESYMLKAHSSKGIRESLI